MMLNEVKRLRPGDEVFWNDPDAGTCSKVVKIQTVEIRPHGPVILTDMDGSVLECFASELS